MALKDDFKKGWLGIVIGGIVGFLSSKFFVNVQEVQSLFSTQSLIDTTIGAVQVTTKSAIIFIIIGAVIGFYIQLNRDKLMGLFR